MTSPLKAFVSGQNSRARALELPAALTAEERTRTIVDFQGLCAYCQMCPIEALDHFVPLSRGGGSTAGNRLPSCRQCDRIKNRKHSSEAIPEKRFVALRDYLAARSTGQDIGIPQPLLSGSAKILFRFPEELIAALDAWAEELNEGKPWLLMTRSDLVRDVLLWAAQTRPNFKSRT